MSCVVKSQFTAVTMLTELCYNTSAESHLIKDDLWTQLNSGS